MILEKNAQEFYRKALFALSAMRVATPDTGYTGLSGVLSDMLVAQRRYERLYAACQSLFDADHHDHFASRMSDSEMAAIEDIREAMKA